MLTIKFLSMGSYNKCTHNMVTLGNKVIIKLNGNNSNIFIAIFSNFTHSCHILKFYTLSLSFLSS